MKSILSIILLVSSLIAYQEMNMTLKQSKDLSFQFIETTPNARVKYEKPILLSVNEEYVSMPIWFSSDAFYFEKSLYQYEAFDIEVGFINKSDMPNIITNLNCTKKEDAPKNIETDYFKLSDYYEATHTNWYRYPMTIEHLKSTLNQQPLLIDIHGMNDFDKNTTVIHSLGMIDDEPNHVMLSYVPQNAIKQGRSLWMKIAFDETFERYQAEDGSYLYPLITFSPFVEPFIYQANQVNFKLVQTNKESKEKTIVGENNQTIEKEFNHDYLLGDNHYFYGIKYQHPLDFESNDYAWIFTFFKDDQQVFHQEVVIQP